MTKSNWVITRKIKLYKISRHIFALLFIYLSFFQTNESRSQVIDGFRNNSTDIVREACKKALASEKLDDQHFVKTECGMYMLGYAHAAHGMWYASTSETGYSEGVLKVLKNRPYCDNEFVKLSDLAKLFLDEEALRKGSSETFTIMLMALHKKYPCDKYFEDIEKEFQEHGIQIHSNNKEDK